MIMINAQRVTRFSTYGADAVLLREYPTILDHRQTVLPKPMSVVWTSQRLKFVQMSSARLLKMRGLRPSNSFAKIIVRHIALPQKILKNRTLLTYIRANGEQSAEMWV
jgi:hypothetical protein